MQMLKEQNLIDDAITIGKLAITKFKNDTTSHFLLGELYNSKKGFIKSLNHYSEASSIMKYNIFYQTILPNFTPVFGNDCQMRIAEIYAKLNEIQLTCDALFKAKDLLKLETRPDKAQKENELQDKINQYCKD